MVSMEGEPLKDSPVIVAAGLRKVFGNQVAVQGLDLEIRKGELFGLVGPDGAGKTTIMRLLTGIMKPTAGECLVVGHSSSREPEKVKERIGYMSQRFGLYEDLTVMENLLFYADLYDVPPAERPPRLEQLLGFSNLAPFTSRLAGNLSGGMKQKLGLACTLIHSPLVLFLDEPTNGVDPVSRRDFWHILYDLLKDGITIFVSTSYLDEAERCTRIALIHKGSVLAIDQPARIKGSLKLPMVEFYLAHTRRAAELISPLAGVQGVSVYGDRLHITMTDPVLVESITATLRQNGIDVQGTREIIPSLEDVFISMVREQSL
jgi:ABC-2 type transport system ATP-binding protein